MNVRWVEDGRCDACVFGSGTIAHCSCPECCNCEILQGGAVMMKVGHYEEVKEDESK